MTKLAPIAKATSGPVVVTLSVPWLTKSKEGEPRLDAPSATSSPPSSLRKPAPGPKEQLPPANTMVP